jgi:hypothetical protein
LKNPEREFLITEARKSGNTENFNISDVTRAGVAQVAKPARLPADDTSTGRFGNLRYDDGA